MILHILLVLLCLRVATAWVAQTWFIWLIFLPYLCFLRQILLIPGLFLAYYCLIFGLWLSAAYSAYSCLIPGLFLPYFCLIFGLWLSAAFNKIHTFAIIQFQCGAQSNGILSICGFLFCLLNNSYFDRFSFWSPLLFTLENHRLFENYFSEIHLS
jgi:hypothetical protein